MLYFAHRAGLACPDAVTWHIVISCLEVFLFTFFYCWFFSLFWNKAVIIKVQFV